MKKIIGILIIFIIILFCTYIIFNINSNSSVKISDEVSRSPEIFSSASSTAKTGKKEKLEKVLPKYTVDIITASSVGFLSNDAVTENIESNNEEIITVAEFYNTNGSVIWTVNDLSNVDEEALTDSRLIIGEAGDVLYKPVFIEKTN